MIGSRRKRRALPICRTVSITMHVVAKFGSQRPSFGNPRNLTIPTREIHWAVSRGGRLEQGRAIPILKPAVGDCHLTRA